MKSNDITLAIEIPSGFGRLVKRGSDWQVSAWIDGANTSRASTIEGYAGSAQPFAEQRSRESSSAVATGPSTTIPVRNRYNPTGESIYAIGPSARHVTDVVPGYPDGSQRRIGDKEIGTIANFYATPVTRLEYLLGKQLHTLASVGDQFLIMTATVLFLFGAPLKGSAITLAMVLSYACRGNWLRLVLSSFTSSQVAAIFAAAVLSMLPTMQFSGMMQPVSTLEARGSWARCG